LAGVGLSWVLVVFVCELVFDLAGCLATAVHGFALFGEAAAEARYVGFGEASFWGWLNQGGILTVGVWLVL
jgi:hypothetical protein